MAWWDRFTGSGKRSTVEKDWFALLDKQGASAIESVSVNAALRVWAVQACVRVLSDSVASLPLHLYKRLERGRERFDMHPAAQLLHAPSTRYSEFGLRKTAVSHRLLWGNAYLPPVMSPTGEWLELEPIDPWGVQVHRTDRSMLYKWRDHDNEPVEAVGSQMVHIKGMSGNGLVGYSVIGSLMRDAVALAAYQNKSARALMRNGSRPDGVVTIPSVAKPGVIDALRKAWKETYGGSNQGGTAVLDAGATYTAISMPPEAAQFIQQREFSVLELAGMFGVPPHLIGITGKSSYASAEQNNLEFVQYSIVPLVTCIEQELTRILLTPREVKQGLYFRHNVAGLLRGDMKTRYESYAVGVSNGWLSRNDVREMEEMNAVDGLDEYLAPLNMTTSGALEADAERIVEGEIDKPSDASAAGKAPTPTAGNSQQPRAKGRASKAKVTRGRKWTAAEVRAFAVMPYWADGEELRAEDDDVDEDDPDGDANDESLTETQRSVRKERQGVAKSVREVWTDAAQRLVKREVADLRRRMQREGVTAAELQEWIKEFYVELAKAVPGYFRAALRTTVRLALKSVAAEIGDEVAFEDLREFVDEYLAHLATAWTGSSEGQLAALLTIPAPTEEGQQGPIEAALERIDQWEERRADKRGRDEAYASTNASALAAMAVAGIAAKVWLARGNSCPFCRSLNGRRVAINAPFVDGSISAGGQTMQVHGIKRHPPTHGGCDCTVGAA